MTNPEPVPCAPLTLIMTTLGRTLAAIPAIEPGGRFVTAGGTVPRLKAGSVPADEALDSMYPPTRPPATAAVRAVQMTMAASREPATRLAADSGCRACHSSHGSPGCCPGCPASP